MLNLLKSQLLNKLAVKKHIFFILIFLALAQRGFSQFPQFNHPELDWYTLETTHFKVHYHNGSERTAQIVAKIAEDIYEPITSLYQWEPDAIIHFIIKDYDDNSNGAAFYYDNKVEIWAPKMTFILRGTHNWLRNVVTHEFAHMISLGASRKITRRVPSFFFQMFNYEVEKRPDVLYGYPNIIASYPIPMTIVPMWLAEGMAQYQVSGLDYDRWDSHRDMLIRTAVYKDNMLSFDEMGVFGKNSLGNERTYNAGYAFTRYIVRNWGEESLQELTVAMRKPFNTSINGALKKITGLEAKELFAKWQAELNSYYQDRLKVIRDHIVEGNILTEKGIGNVYPAFSPDGNAIAYCGSKSNDYLSRTHLKIYDPDQKKFKVIQPGVNSIINWSPDGKKLLYVKKRKGEHASFYNDLYIHDLESSDEKQITHDQRTYDPDWSADGKKIVCVVQKDGTDNLVIFNNDGKLEQRLTDFKSGEGITSPCWSPDGKFVVFSRARKHGRDLILMNTENGETRKLVKDKGDARDPVFSADGKSIYFSWDKSGIFNIYSIDKKGNQLKQWTNVIGGAFMPSISKKEQLLYSDFKYDGYKIAMIENPEPVAEKNSQYLPSEVEGKIAFNKKLKKTESLAINDYDDTNFSKISSKPYSMTYGQISFLPRIMIDSNRVKLGTYFYASDILDKYSILGGVAIDGRTDMDIFSIFEYRQFAPTLFLELYAFTRHIKRSIEVIEDYPKKVPVDIGFRIYEAVLGGQINPSRSQTVRLSIEHSRYSNKIKDFFFQGIKWVSPMNTYFKGNRAALSWRLNQKGTSVTSGINPSSGRTISFRYSKEWNKFFKDFATNNEYGTLQEVYTNYNYNRIELDWVEYFENPLLPEHSLSVNIKGGWIDRPVDSFFNFFAGGMPGLRGYPFYSIDGRKLLLGRFTYRLPVFTHLQKRLFNLTTDKMYLGAFFDYGNAFNEDKIDFSAFRKDVGINLRFSLFSFYGYPTALSIDAAYGLDEYDYQTEGDELLYSYGKEWRFYLTLLFDFID